MTFYELGCMVSCIDVCTSLMLRLSLNLFTVLISVLFLPGPSLPKFSVLFSVFFPSSV